MGILMATRFTTVEWEVTLGQSLRQLRLRQNIDQRQLAARANVALNAVKRLEGGKGATVTSLVKVLRALGREEWLGTLAPPVTVSPLQMLKARKPVRQRASPSREERRV
jgi:transcriptional regulator with XRE-family HTH domain